MVLIKDEEEIKKNLKKFLYKCFPGNIKRNIKIFEGFAADYLIIKGKKKRIILFRNPPVYPKHFIKEIQTCLSRGYIVYIAAYTDPSTNDLLDDLIERCTGEGIGTIKCEGKNNFIIVKKAKLDYPEEKLNGMWAYIFISSKLSAEERDITYNIVKQLKYQPICVERINLNGVTLDECKKWINQSKLFIGVVTPKYSNIVEKEIKHALSKFRERCLIFIKGDCKISELSNKDIIRLIEKVIKPKTTFVEYHSIDELKKEIKKRLPQLVNANLK